MTSICYMQKANVSLNDWSYEAKNIFYQTEKISPEKALMYQLCFAAVPFANVGYAYSDNWVRGAIIDIYRTGLFLANIYALNENMDGLAVLSVLSYSGLSIYKYIDITKI